MSVDFAAAASHMAAEDLAARWRLISTADIFAELEPYPWLVPGLHLGPGRVTLLNGYPDVGKTVIAMSWALAVASAAPVWGLFRTENPGKVVHLNGEIGNHLARERYQRLARGHGIDVAGLIASGNLVLSDHPQTDLTSPTIEDELTKICTGASLVIMDSLRAFSGALNENAKEIGMALLMLGRVSSATGCTIVVLHHNRKMHEGDVGGAKQAISGSSSILGGAEAAFVMQSEEKGGLILVKHERSPMGRTMEDFGLIIEDVPSDANARWGLVVRHLDGKQLAEEREAIRERANAPMDALCDRVKALLADHGGVYQGGVSTIAKLWGHKNDKLVDRAVKKLEERREITLDGTGNKRRIQVRIGTDNKLPV